MTELAVVSGRGIHHNLADFCAWDFEDAIVADCGAALHVPAATDRALRCEAQVVFVVAISFAQMIDLLARVDLPAEAQVVGYVFGAYGHETQPGATPLARWQRQRARRPLRKLTRLYGGIEDHIDLIAGRLDLDTRYLPMAANVLAVGARPPSDPQDRPISVTSFGRQHLPTAQALSEAFNRAGSDRLFYATNFLHTSGVADGPSYRAMFWQILRQSRVALAFDQRYAPNAGGAHLSYLGPRWFESLAAGAVVAGRHPATPDRQRLLDWPDALIDLPEDPADSVGLLHDLTGDFDRLRAISARNLSEMSRRHDWGHRLAVIFDDLGMAPPDGLRARLAILDKRAEAFAATERSAGDLPQARLA